MVVIEVDLSKQAVAARIESHAIVHRCPLQPENGGCSLRPNAVPRGAVKIHPEAVRSSGRLKVVSPKCYRISGPNSSAICPPGKCMTWIKNGFADFGVSNISTGFGGILRILPGPDLTG